MKFRIHFRDQIKAMVMVMYWLYMNKVRFGDEDEILFTYLFYDYKMKMFLCSRGAKLLIQLVLLMPTLLTSSFPRRMRRQWTFILVSKR